MGIDEKHHCTPKKSQILGTIAYLEKKNTPLSSKLMFSVTLL
jgi:hypothetical protein